MLHRIASYLQRRLGAIWALADQAFISLANFVTILLIVRSTTGDVFGSFILAYTVLLVLTAVQHAGLTQAHHNLHARFRKRHADELSGTVLIAQTILAGAAAMLVLIISLFLEDGNARLTLTLAAIIPLWLAQDLVRRFLYSLHRSRAAFVNDVVSYGGQLGGVVLLLSLGTVTAVSALLILGASSAVACMVGAFQLRKELSFRHLRTPRHLLYLRESWRFGSWLGTSEILKWSGRHGATWLVALVSGVAVLGPFKAVLHIVNVLNPLKLAAFAWMPTHAARVHALQGDAALRSWLGKRMLMLLIPYGIIALSVVASGDLLLTALYGDRYNTGLYTTLLALGVGSHAIHFVRALVQLGLIAQRRTRLVFIESVLSVLLMGTVGLGLLMWMGLTGILLGEILTATVLLALNIHFLFRSSPSLTQGHEAVVNIRHADGTVLKRHHDRAGAESEFALLTRLERVTERTGAGFSTPRALSLDRASGSLTMSLEPGTQLQQLVESEHDGDSGTWGYALGSGLRSIRDSSGNSIVMPDFGPHNALWDESGHRLTMIDFGPGQSGSVQIGEAGQLLAHVAIRLAHPARVARRKLWLKYVDLIRSAFHGLGCEPTHRDLREALVKVDFDSQLGPWTRRIWMQLVAPVALRALFNRVR